MQAHAKPLTPLAVQQQHIRGDQQHLKKDKQVEQVAGDEGPGQAHQLKLEQCMEVAAVRIPAAGGVPQHRCSQRPGQRQHQGAEPVGHQHDAKRG